MLVPRRLALGLALCLGIAGAIPSAQGVTLDALNTAAAAGDVAAQMRLGDWYNHGNRVEKNFKTARFWYQKAARQGDPRAAYELGILYELGRGVLQDNATAAWWFHQGAEGGYGPAKERFARYRRFLPALPPAAATAANPSEG